MSQTEMDQASAEQHEEMATIALLHASEDMHFLMEWACSKTRGLCILSLHSLCKSMGVTRWTLH